MSSMIISLGISLERTVRIQHTTFISNKFQEGNGNSEKISHFFRGHMGVVLGTHRGSKFFLEIALSLMIFEIKNIFHDLHQNSRW